MSIQTSCCLFERDAEGTSTNIELQKSSKYTVKKNLSFLGANFGGVFKK